MEITFILEVRFFFLFEELSEKEKLLGINFRSRVSPDENFVVQHVVHDDDADEEVGGGCGHFGGCRRTTTSREQKRQRTRHNNGEDFFLAPVKKNI